MPRIKGVKKSNKKALNTLISEELKEKLDKYANANGYYKTEVVELCLIEFFKKHSKEG